VIKSVSIIYPVYNEENRLNKTFFDIKNFDKSNKFLKKQYIFVNDGSTDQSLSIIKKRFKRNKRVKIISYSKNMGKGYAIKKGVLIAKNQWVLTTDADCSVSNFQLINWIKSEYLNKKIFIYFASRNHPLSLVKKKIIRQFIGFLFKLLLLIFFKIKISDTQCGFKLYKLNIAKKIFKMMLINDYMHDVEIYKISEKLNLKIKVLPVNWNHADQSQINFFLDFFKILLSLKKIFKLYS
jgi:dolichyl-phosphate beta-glucosyltransferase